MKRPHIPCPSLTVPLTVAAVLGCCLGYLVQAVMQKRRIEAKNLDVALQTLEGEGGPVFD